MIRKVLLIAALGVAGCASTEESLLLQESPNFQIGYNDGCSTASEAEKSFSTKQTRDTYLFDNDKAYQAGWRQGYLGCTSKIPEAKDGGRILGERDEF